MRHVATILGIVMLAALAGCTSTRWGFVKNGDKPTGPAGGAGDAPSVAQIVDWMNANAARIHALRVEDVDITCTYSGKSFGIRGTLVTEKPYNFRMGAGTLGNQVVDLGSNKEEFWYWISKANPPYQFYCSYDDLKAGRATQMPFPFQPQWVMETIGLGPYGPPEKYTLERAGDTLRLTEKTTSPKGEPVRKVIVFRKQPVSPPNAQVTDYLLLDDATGKEICAAHISDVQLDKHTNAIVPKRIELHWPAEKLKLNMRFADVTVDPPVNPQMFTRRTIKGVQSFNLARMQVDNSPPPQAYSGLDSKIRPVQGLTP